RVGAGRDARVRRRVLIHTAEGASRSLEGPRGHVRASHRVSAASFHVAEGSFHVPAMSFCMAEGAFHVPAAALYMAEGSFHVPAMSFCMAEGAERSRCAAVVST